MLVDKPQAVELAGSKPRDAHGHRVDCGRVIVPRQRQAPLPLFQCKPTPRNISALPSNKS